MQRSRSTRRRCIARAFSLVEVLVVISIASIILALSVPSVRGLLLQGQVASNSTALAAAADTARRLAKSQAVQPGFPEAARYEGVAMIVTPSGQIRMAVNDPGGREEPGTAGVAPYLAQDNPADRWSGFRDIEELDYITLTAGSDIYGIDYDGNFGGNLFLPPPFAIRFDGQGQLVVGSVTSLTGREDGQGSADNPFKLHHGQTQERLVVYLRYDNEDDPEDDPRYVTKETRLSNPAFDPRQPGYDPSEFEPTWSPVYERFNLPFGVLEAVGAVRIVSAGDNPRAPENAFTDLIFSRYSGSPTRIQSNQGLAATP